MLGQEFGWLKTVRNEVKESFGSQVGSCFGLAFLIALLRVCARHCQVFEVTPPPLFGWLIWD